MPPQRPPAERASAERFQSGPIHRASQVEPARNRGEDACPCWGTRVTLILVPSVGRASATPERGGTGPPTPQVMIGMISSATMFATLIIGLIAGPAVSL